MSKAKPLNFEGAELRHTGGRHSGNGIYDRNHWSVRLADGTLIKRDIYNARGLAFQWEKWYPNKARVNHYDRDGSWRPLQDFDNNAVDHWVKSHPDYRKDGTVEVKNHG